MATESDARLTFRDPLLQTQFERDGYVIVSALEGEQVRALRDRALAALAPAPDINDPQGALYGTLFDPERRQDGERLADAILTPLLDSLLDDYRHEGGYVVAKLAKTGRLDMHQHQPVTSDIYEPAVHCWLTLDDVDADSGALRVVPGSHRILRHVQSFSTPSYFSTFAEPLERSHATSLKMRAGEAVIFERSLLHGSAENRRDEMAIRILGTAIPRESRLCILAEKNGAFEALEVGESVIDPKLYCIADGNTAGLRPAGRIANRNTAITESEFSALVTGGTRIRRGFDPIDAVRSAASGGWLESQVRKVRDALTLDRRA